jgi:hypothetical protein
MALKRQWLVDVLRDEVNHTIDTLHGDLARIV